MSAVGLSELHVAPAIRYIEARGGTVTTGAEVTGFETYGSNVTAVRFRDGRAQSFDGYVCAVPHTVLPTLLPAEFAESAEMLALRQLPTAPIINLHCWFDRPVADFAFASFVGCELQWVFNRDRLDRSGSERDHHIVVSLSGAQPYMGLTKRELEERFVPQLRAVLPARARCGTAAIRRDQGTGGHLRARTGRRAAFEQNPVFEPGIGRGLHSDGLACHDGVRGPEWTARGRGAARTGACAAA